MKKHINAHQLVEILLGPNVSGFPRLLNTINRDHLEAIYQQKIKDFSPAYLAGSSWYVGPSLLPYLDSQPLNKGVLYMLMWLSHKCSSYNG